MYFVCKYTLLKVVSHYDLSVLSMSVMGFQKKVCIGVQGFIWKKDMSVPWARIVCLFEILCALIS